jgi:hypothetical protein
MRRCFGLARPTRRAGTLTRKQCDLLVPAIRETLNEAILAGGSTLRDFVGSDGNPGLPAAVHGIRPSRRGLPDMRYRNQSGATRWQSDLLLSSVSALALKWLFRCRWHQTASQPDLRFLDECLTF